MTDNRTRPALTPASFLVTTSAKADARLDGEARSWASLFGVPYVPRGKGVTLPSLLAKTGVDALLVATETGPRVHTAEGTLFYHPGLGTVRWQRVALRGEKDNFLEAMDLRPGQRVLDCTVGLAADALLASHAVGPGGEVTGLEASPLLWFLSSRGVQTYVGKFPALTEDLRRVTIHRTEAADYLQSLPADRYDVVYFDPMFRHPVRRSSAMQPLRPLAYGGALTREVVREALRVAPRVVVKERTEAILREFGCRRFTGSRYSGVRFGIVLRGEESL
ncbi:MAG: class I SAM-dependent methyltransferase [Succiniclasticum sp.]|nr:class I SAM-dependent methyltransferase [Succiniclasticum sp.]